MAKGKKVGKAAKVTKKKPSPKAKPKAPAKEKAVTVVAPPPAVEPCACGHDHGPVDAGPAPEENDWRAAFGDVVDFLRYMDDIVKAIGQDDIPKEEFITLLRDLDELGLTMKSLDIERTKGLDPEDRRLLFRYFISDVFLKKMKVQHELEPLSRCDSPVFSRMLLGLVQTVIAAHLNTAHGAAAEAPESEDDLMPEPALLDSLWTEEDKPVLGFTEEDLAEGLWNLISPIDMLRLTSTAVMAYLTWRDPKMAEDVMVEGLASLTPPVFILMACSDALEDLTRGLVTGRPLLRKVQDDGVCSKGAGFHFVMSAEGQARLT